MNVDSRPLVAWIRDVLLAYAGGLVLGAPFALLAVWLTGRDSAATFGLLMTMAVLFVVRRRRNARPIAKASARLAADRRAA
jgi:hypothetical protein